MLEIAEGTKLESSLLPVEQVEKGFNEFKIQDKFSSLGNNLIIKGTKNEKELNDLYNKNKELFFVDIDNTLDYESEKEFIINNSHRIIVNPKKNRSKIYHKLESLSTLIKPSMDYLKSMFKYNNTIKDFSKILEIGKYEVAIQYSVKDIMEIIDDNYDRYNEKGSYIGHMEAKSRLDFYPTNFDFQYASLLDCFNFELKELKHIKKSTKIWLEENTGFTQEKGFSNIKPSVLYRLLLNKKRFDYIDEIFLINNGFVENGNQVVVADLFAGEGDWLNLYKKFSRNKYFYIVANELEENRFNKIKAKNFNFIKNKAYEELTELPKELINICLFNPPYGKNDGKPMVESYLEMLLEDKYLAKEALVIFALRFDDSLAMLDTLFKYFTIDMESIFKDTGNEANKLKQICFVGKLRSAPIDIELNYNQAQLRNFKNSFKKVAEERSLHVKIANDNKKSYSFKRVNASDVRFKFDTHNIKENPHLYVSDTNGPLWEIAKNALSIDTFSGKKVKLPNEPKTPGSIANLISSGLMNGEIKGKHNHCLAAGTTIAKCQTLSEDGKTVIATKKAVQFCYIQSGGKIVRVSSDILKDDITIDSEGMVHQV